MSTAFAVAYDGNERRGTDQDGVALNSQSALARSNHWAHTSEGRAKAASIAEASNKEKARKRAERHMRKAIISLAAEMVESGELFELADPTAEIARRLHSNEALVDATLICHSHATERARRAQMLALRNTEGVADECYEDTMNEYGEEMAA
jgi:hypothetical protein